MIFCDWLCTESSLLNSEHTFCICCHAWWGFLSESPKIINQRFIGKEVIFSSYPAPVSYIIFLEGVWCLEWMYFIWWYLNSEMPIFNQCCFQDFFQYQNFSQDRDFFQVNEASWNQDHELDDYSIKPNNEFQFIRFTSCHS